MLELLGLVGIAVVYKFIKGDSEPVEYTNMQPEEKHELSNEEETFNYFMSLTYPEQEQYYEDNLDLRFYKDDLRLGYTDNKYRNAQHAAEIARITNKAFINKNKTY